MRRTRRRNIVQRRRAERRGRLAEWLCLWHLRLRGWRIVARGWRCPAGEIDIIARRGPGARDHRGQVPRGHRRGGDGARAAPAPPHRARRRSISRHPARPRRARPPIRSDAGPPASLAAPLARRLGRRPVEAHSRDRSFSSLATPCRSTEFDRVRESPSWPSTVTPPPPQKWPQDLPLETLAVYPKIRGRHLGAGG